MLVKSTSPFVWDTLALVDAKFLEFREAPTTSLSIGWVVFSAFENACLLAKPIRYFLLGLLSRVFFLRWTFLVATASSKTLVPWVDFRLHFSMAGFDRQQASFVSMLASNEKIAILLHILAQESTKKKRQKDNKKCWWLLSFSRVLGKNCGSSYPHFFITAYILCLHYFSIEAFHSIQQCTEQKMCKDKGRRHKLQNLTCPMYYSLAATLTKLPLQVHKQPASNATQSPAKKSANFDSRVKHCPWGIIVSIDVLGENGSVRPPCSLPHPIATWGSCRWNETLM